MENFGLPLISTSGYTDSEIDMGKCECEREREWKKERKKERETMRERESRCKSDKRT